MTEQTSTLNRIGFGDLDADALTSNLARHGHVYIDHIPDHFDHAGFLAERLGPLMPQYDGQIVWSIKAEKNFDDTYHSLNTKKLTPHTECYELQGTPPKYLALWCIVPNEDSGGQTTLADGRAFVQSLTEAERQRLRTHGYQFVSSAGLQQMNLGEIARHPILEERDDRNPILRFSCQCIYDADPFCKDITARLQEFFDQAKVEIDFTRQSLLIWDNHRVLHSRNAFTDSRRHLRRVWIAEQ